VVGLSLFLRLCLLIRVALTYCLFHARLRLAVPAGLFPFIGHGCGARGQCTWRACCWALSVLRGLGDFGRNLDSFSLVLHRGGRDAIVKYYR